MKRITAKLKDFSFCTSYSFVFLLTLKNNKIKILIEGTKEKILRLKNVGEKESNWSMIEICQFLPTKLSKKIKKAT